MKIPLFVDLFKENNFVFVFFKKLTLFYTSIIISFHFCFCDNIADNCCCNFSFEFNSLFPFDIEKLPILPPTNTSTFCVFNFNDVGLRTMHNNNTASEHYSDELTTTGSAW